MSKENIESYELKAKLSEILRRVRAGESFTITNNGKPVADLLPSKTASRQKTAVAIDNILRMSRTTVRFPMTAWRSTGRKIKPCDSIYVLVSLTHFFSTCWIIYVKSILLYHTLRICSVSADCHKSLNLINALYENYTGK